MLYFNSVTSFSIPVRLRDGSSSLDGRVEVLKESGVWGTICDYYFSTVEGSVICRQLGFYGASTTFNYAHYPLASNNTPIALTYVFCSGDETQFGDCYHAHNTWGFHYCTHADDVGVVCLGEYM